MADSAPFPRLRAAFAQNFAEGLERGAALCVQQNGREGLHLCGGEAREGRAWTPETLVPVYSATKAASAACLLLALYDCCRGPELEVGEIWPRFPAPHLSIAELLSHQSGLAALHLSAVIFDLDACRYAIEHSRPRWGPPVHGYHPHTIGPMIDILMLELTGKRLGAFWEERVRAPLGLDFYIGLPVSERTRVAELRAPRLHSGMPHGPFYDAYFDPSSEVYAAFHSITGLSSAREMNTPAAWECASPAKGGVASARGLASFYQALLGQLPGSPFPPEILEQMSEPQSRGLDRILMRPTSFTCGCMCEPAELFGEGGFGHAGAGGCHAFCEPSCGCSFAYVMNAMEMGILPGRRVLRLIDALLEDRRCGDA
ncbi:MAG TPA: beta-lactamase family protein [Candidatus Akkermansia intestinigallinarum]|uniref:Beta-lactamase family protein n=1 Tax=Candidatus Akkermansia intestinigallinarum TaxID=2838431 RepID=A0A9D1VAZ0_9BACT|nr:beta-lactamase family protein [Candidatus Akkermansia intestinigallinarum]